MSGCSVDFPIYDITSIDSVRVALCGGGGAVKSGVPNAVEVYDTRGKGLVLAYRYDCERAAPTCIAAHPGEPILAVGVDHNLLILEIEKKQKLNKQVPTLKKVLQREVVKVTDKAEIVKCVTFCCFGEKLVTVGEDNGITIWEYPSMVRRWRITQHLSEVTQVTAHTMGEPEIVTSTRGSECFVWDVETGMQKAQLKFSGTVPNAKYRYRNIRYGCTGETFYSVIVPIAWSNKTSMSHLVKYDTATTPWSIIREFTIKGEPLSELAVSSNETFIATSSSNGHVYILDAHSLGLRRRVFEAHGLFVTGLCFTSSHTDDQFKLLSVSADRECKVHNPHLADPVRFLKAALLLLLFIGALYFLFKFLSSSDLLPHIDDFDADPIAEDHHTHSHHNEL
ncbi:hypothetical protein ACHWQZ_G018214 [Mnemiopsis leidyi]